MFRLTDGRVAGLLSLSVWCLLSIYCLCSSRRCRLIQPNFGDEVGRIQCSCFPTRIDPQTDNSLNKLWCLKKWYHDTVWWRCVCMCVNAPSWWLESSNELKLGLLNSDANKSDNRWAWENVAIIKLAHKGKEDADNGACVRVLWLISCGQS